MSVYVYLSISMYIRVYVYTYMCIRISWISVRIHGYVDHVLYYVIDKNIYPVFK